MAKLMYEGLSFDSQLEVDYYIDRKEDESVINLYIHGDYKQFKIEVGNRKNYAPDFVVEYDDRIEIIETKGYDKWNGPTDKMIAQHMKYLADSTPDVLRNWLREDNINTDGKRIVFQRIKKLGTEFVDFDFKRPNRYKVLYEETKVELKDFTTFKKDTVKYFTLKQKDKLTAKQQEFVDKYEEEIRELIS